MKRAMITARKVAAEQIVQQLRRGRKPFHGARGPAGAKDLKDLRGPKGLLLKEAEELARAEERERVTVSRRALSRSSSTTSSTVSAPVAF
jgi:hypothetical protein